MRFWDSSALLPLVVEEASSRACRDLARSDPIMIVWAFTAVEVWGGCCRKLRAGELAPGDLDRARARLSRLEERWREVSDFPAVRAEAERALLRHDLRAADALQLGAALVGFGPKPQGRPFVSRDIRLLEAARVAGFATVEPG